MGWMKFAVGEGLTKTASALLQKLVGKLMSTIEMGCVAGIIIGTIQMVGGFLGFARKSHSNPAHLAALVPDLRSVGWALLFGFFAAIPGTVWSIYTFTLGADLAVRTLLMTCAIIPGAFIGRMIWSDPLGFFEWTGITLFLVAVWAILDFPSLTEIGDLPLWVPAVLVITFTQPINEALSRAASVKLNIWVNNFWVGASTVFSCLTLLIVIGFVQGGVALPVSDLFLFGNVVIGCIVLAMISFKLLSYAGGGTIALKKLIMNASYLVTVAIAGVLFYHEPLTVGKIVGIMIFPLAFTFTDRDTRRYFSTVLSGGDTKKPA